MESVLGSESHGTNSAIPKLAKIFVIAYSHKSHMRRFINEGNDINTAGDMKAAIESYGGVKGC